MDKETAERLTKLEGQVNIIDEERKAWGKLIRDAIMKTVTWLVLAGSAGLLYGWHLPENIRKFLSDQISK